MGIYRFNDSATAYEARQRTRDIVFGDTLVVESESVVAVACTFPFAVSAAKGEFDGFIWDAPVNDPNVLLNLVNAIRAAVTEAERLGIAINAAFSRFSPNQSSDGNANCLPD
jgi:hypothetical protein